MANQTEARANFRRGYKEGYDKLRLLLLTHLEERYIAPGLDAASAEGKAILNLARDVAQFMRDNDPVPPVR